MRTRSAHIGTQPAPIGSSLKTDQQLKEELKEQLRSEGKIKAVYELWRYLQRIPALAALTWVQKVIQTSECKVKGTDLVLLQLPRSSADAATCPLLDRLTFDSLAPQAPDRHLKQEERAIMKEGKVKGTKVRFL
jgi:hypothetical protein